MKILLSVILTALVIFGLAACSGGDQDQGETEANVAAQTVDKTDVSLPETEAQALQEKRLEQCRAATKKLGTALKSALQEAMGEGGPVAAVNVCHDEATKIAEQICEEEGLVVGRTSGKVRNQSNAPDDWEKAGLNAFTMQIAGGAKPKDLEIWATITEPDSTRTFRYLKAIPTAPVCLKCHGSELTPDLAEKLAELYPEDQATGFEVGDMRGAFTVKIGLPRL